MAEHKKRVREASNNDSDDDDYIDDDNSEYEVEKVVSHRKVNGKLEYQVKWAGWDDSNCTDLMQEYWSSKDSASRPSNYANSRAVGVGTSSSTRFRNTAKSTNTRRPMNGPGSGGPPFSQSGQPKKQRKEEDLDDFREIKDGSYPPAGTDWEKEVGRIAGMGRFIPRAHCPLSGPYQARRQQNYAHHQRCVREMPSEVIDKDDNQMLSVDLWKGAHKDPTESSSEFQPLLVGGLSLGNDGVSIPSNSGHAPGITSSWRPSGRILTAVGASLPGNDFTLNPKLVELILGLNFEKMSNLLYDI
ncbi:hypothetical protein BC936DRAFT_148849 [Jimgerdemannia flammicorona]|uniref:Chromo domain-containing protein n=1 Tax=Jimgerdemannia flammicorona TaxID=994334 RepID=A0A433D272_9FUNG|nr:hypothetical protein BC936DRAFT_148849 [Jimgerdemannia flammicorona]